MSEDVHRLSLSKKGQRKVTPFTGNELLYDYMSGILDEERRKAVELHLKESPEAQTGYQKIQGGLQYTEKLKNITVSPALHERLSASSTYLTVLFKKSKFDQWPVGLKWGLEALMVVFVIVTFLTVAPWEKVMKLRLSTGTSEVVLTELNKTPAVQTAALNVPETAATPEFVDEGIKSKDGAPSSSSVVYAKNEIQAPAATVTPIAKVATTPTPVKKAEPARPASATTTASATATEETGTHEASGEATKSSGGFVYRGQIAVTNLEAVGPRIKEKIVELGGRKAGEVELGWTKTPGSAYFHFTIPEAKYDELQTFLSEYGKARISKDKHPRVMPDGIIRLIITVDEAKK